MKEKKVDYRSDFWPMNAFVAVVLWFFFFYLLVTGGSAFWMWYDLIVAALNTVIAIHSLSLPPFPKETEEDIEDLNRATVTSGYMPYLGKVIYTDEIKTITFKQKEDIDTFPQVSNIEGDHGNFHYWDYGKYRVVKFHGRNPKYFVRI